MSGQLRTGVDAIPGILRFVGDRLHQTDWFIHTWDWGQQRPSTACREYPRRRVEMWMMDRMVDAYRPRSMRVDDHDAVMAGRGLSLQGNHAQWIGIQLCDEMRQAWCRDTGTVHDVVIRLRPDVVYPGSNTLDNWVSTCLGSPANWLLSAISDPRRVDDVLWAAVPGTMELVAAFAHRLPRLQRGGDIATGFMEHLASVGVVPVMPFDCPLSRIYAPLREESRHLHHAREFRQIWTQDLMLYSAGFPGPNGTTLTASQWIDANSSLFDQL